MTAGLDCSDVGNEGRLTGGSRPPCSGGMFGCGWAPHRASEPFISVPVPIVKPRTGWIGGEALPPDTLRHEPLPVAAPPQGVASAWGAKKGAVACLSAEGWALWVHGGSPALLYSHRGYPPVGEAFAQNLLAGPPLGALRRCVRALRRFYHSCRRSSGEFKRGKWMGCAAS